MINQDRIVPVTATDLLTLYSVVFASGGSPIYKVGADDASAGYIVVNEPQSTSGKNIAKEPAKRIVIPEISYVNNCSIIFIPAYDYEGIEIGGELITAEGAVEADGRSLYRASFVGGNVTISKIGF